MSKKSTIKITCPHCSKNVILDEALSQSLQEDIGKQLEKKYSSQVAQVKKEITERENEIKSLKDSMKVQLEQALDEERKNIEKEAKKKAEASLSKELKDLKQQVKEKAEKLEKAEEEELKLRKEKRDLEEAKKKFKLEIEKKLEEEREKIESEAKKKAEASLSKELKDLKQQVEEKAEKLEKAEEEELKLRKEKRDLEEAKKKFELEMERKLDDERKKIYESAVEKVENERELKDKEREKQIDDLKKQINELKRKAEQGSQKLQGEVLEEELENVLREQFVQDEIEPISSGVSGADIIQKVHSKTGQICGSILIETKNAKNWSDGWVLKLKKDQRNVKADMGVIVSTVLPQGVKNFDIREGIVLVDYKDAIPVMMLLRNQLIEVARTKNFNVGKNEKMDAIYRYLTGTEFRQRVEAIVEAFSQMYKDLQKEKRTMIRVWSKREKQIEQAVYGISGMYGGMQGILGSSLPEIKSLDTTTLLDQTEEDREDKDSEAD